MSEWTKEAKVGDKSLRIVAGPTSTVTTSFVDHYGDSKLRVFLGTINGVPVYAPILTLKS
jgi:hypothetical protein